jgi:hypothetical protein
MLNKTKHDLNVAVLRNQTQFPKTLNITKNSMQINVINEVKKMARDIHNDMGESVLYKYKLTNAILTGKSIEIEKTHIDTKKTTLSTILPIGFYICKKKIFKWSGPIELYYNKIQSQLALFDVDVNITPIIKSLFSHSIKADLKTFEYIPIFCAIFNPEYHLIKFNIMDDGNKQPSLIVYSLLKLDKKSSLSNEKFSKFMNSLNILSKTIS